MKNNNVMSTMLDQMFKNAAESQEDELDFFIDLMEAGITLEDIKEFLPEQYEYSKNYMEDHGLI